MRAGIALRVEEHHLMLVQQALGSRVTGHKHQGVGAAVAVSEINQGRRAGEPSAEPEYAWATSHGYARPLSN